MALLQSNVSKLCKRNGKQCKPWSDCSSVDPDQTAPLGAVWSGSALFAQACLSENLRSLRYVLHAFWKSFESSLVFLSPTLNVYVSREFMQWKISPASTRRVCSTSCPLCGPDGVFRSSVNTSRLREGKMGISGVCLSGACISVGPLSVCLWLAAQFI